MTPKESLKRLRIGYDNQLYKQYTASEIEQDKDYNNVLDYIKQLEQKITYINQFKNSKYIVIQDSIAKGFKFNDIKEAVDKLYSLTSKNKNDIGILGCVSGEQVFVIAERKLDWSEEK